MSDSGFPDGPGQSALTREIVPRYHLGWKRCDLEAVLALHRVPRLLPQPQPRAWPVSWKA
jgi:hypothetical protein